MLIAGEVVALLSCAFLLASVLALGTCFGVLPEARGLVTRGPYRLVRHPVYLGELGACAGLVMGAPTAWNLSAAAVLLAAQLVRMRLEERALEREFPEYAAYAARTPRLLPSTRPAPPGGGLLMPLIPHSPQAQPSPALGAAGAPVGRHEPAVHRRPHPHRLSSLWRPPRPGRRPPPAVCRRRAS